MDQEIINSVFYLLPELTLALAIIIITALSSFSDRKNIRLYICSAAIAAAFLLAAFSYTGPKDLCSGLFIADPFSTFIKLLASLTAIAAIFILQKNAEDTHPELFLLATLGATCGASSANLVMTFISIEAMTLPAYILLSKNAKPAFKYYIYSAASSGIFLYGVTLLYGLTGSAGYREISLYLSSNAVNDITLTISVMLITAGLGFKMLLFPFNQSLASVSAGLSYIELFFLAVIPVISAAAVITRFFLSVFHDAGSFNTTHGAIEMLPGVKWQNIIVIVSSLSILTCCLAVFWQQALKKIFSFIVIMLAAYAILPLAAASKEALLAILLNLLLFSLNLTGLVLCLNKISQKLNLQRELELNDLKGLGKNSPVLFTAFIIILASSAGVPITAGFTGRLYALIPLFSAGYTAAGITAILSTIIFLYFIFKAGTLVFSGEPFLKMDTLTGTENAGLLIYVLLIILFGVYPELLLVLIKNFTQIFGI